MTYGRPQYPLQTPNHQITTFVLPGFPIPLWLRRGDDGKSTCWPVYRLTGSSVCLASRMTPQQKDLLFYLTENEILVMVLHGPPLPPGFAAWVLPWQPSMHRGGNAPSAISSAVVGTEIISPSFVGYMLISDIVVRRGTGGGGSSSGVVMGGTNVASGIYNGHFGGHLHSWTHQLEGVDREDESTSCAPVNRTQVQKRKVLEHLPRLDGLGRPRSPGALSSLFRGHNILNLSSHSP